MTQVCIFVSEVAALVGKNKYKSAQDAMIAVMSRNNLVHPKGKSLKEEQERVAKVVEQVQASIAAPPAVETVEKIAVLHKVDATVLAQAVRDPQQENVSVSVKAAVEVIKETAMKEAIQQATTTNNVSKAVAVEALRSVQACNHGIKKEETTRQIYNKQHGGMAKFDQKPVKKTFVTFNGNEYVLFGRLDGFDTKEQCVVEYKNRMNRLFRRVPDYELPQLYAYMILTSTQQAKQVEQFGDETMVHEVRLDEEEWTSIRAELDSVVDKMYEIDRAALQTQDIRKFFI